MNSTLSASTLFAALGAAVLRGHRVRRHPPEDHLSADSKDAVKLTMGLVATMTEVRALVPLTLPAGERAVTPPVGHRSLP